MKKYYLLTLLSVFSLKTFASDQEKVRVEIYKFFMEHKLCGFCKDFNQQCHVWVIGTQTSDEFKNNFDNMQNHLKVLQEEYPNISIKLTHEDSNSKKIRNIELK